MRLTKIYTKVGDQGTTLIVGGDRVPKDSLRIEAYGTVDELNAFLGLWRDELSAEPDETFRDLTDKLLLIQNEMHDLGGELATPLPLLDAGKQQVVSNASISRLEQEIDSMNEQLAPLANFVLPGGHRLNSLSHVCRTICRRAERCIVALCHKEEVRPDVAIYVNRLSDWLFVAGRLVGKRLNIQEVLWRQRSKE
jgi:cob(I)alamin adenosyltransferase